MSVSTSGIATRENSTIKPLNDGDDYPLPWADRMAYAERMLERDLRAYEDARALSGPVIFDRGISDIMGYLTLCGLPVPPHRAAAARASRYKACVFLAPYWNEIFTQDTKRTQTRTGPKRPAPSCGRPTPRRIPNHGAAACRHCNTRRLSLCATGKLTAISRCRGETAEADVRSILQHLCWPEAAVRTKLPISFAAICGVSIPQARAGGFNPASEQGCRL